MCDPTGLAFASFGTQVVGSIANFGIASANAEAANEFQQFQTEEAQRLAIESNRLQQRGLRTRQIQEEQARTEEIRRILDSSRRAQGLLRVSGAEAGVSGGSLDALYQDFELQEAQARQIVQTNQEFADAAFEQEIEALTLSTEGRVIGAISGTQPGPSPFEPLLGITGAGLGLASQLLQINANEEL